MWLPPSRVLTFISQKPDLKMLESWTVARTTPGTDQS